jgi:hypothetical protein
VIAALAVAAQLAVVTHAPESAFACDAIDVTVSVELSRAVVPRLIAPSLRPFDVLRSTTMPRIEQRSQQRARYVAEFRYTITTDRVGTFVLPPFEARVGSERASSSAVTIDVRPARARQLPAVVARARIDTSTSLGLGSAADVDTVFVGQQATYEVAVFLNQAVRERLRRNPTFYPPEMQAMLAYDLPTPTRATRERVGSQCFDALVYRRALFPLVAGRLVIPPAQLVYSTGLSSSSLFSREESHELQTDSVTIIAVEPPTEGRPAEYAGAVGQMQLGSSLDSSRIKVGEPVLMTVSVSGTGNVKLFPRPLVRIPWAGLVAADERVRVDSNTARIGGSKEFDWVLTPRIAGEFDVPPLRYGYFDPSTQRYEVATVARRGVRVAPGTLASADTGQAESALAIRTQFRGSRWPPLQSQPLFWLTLVLAPLPALLTTARRRATGGGFKSLVAPDPMRALVTAAPREPVPLRRSFVKAMAHRLGCNAEDFTHPGALLRALRRAGVSEETAGRAESLLRALDAAAYAGDGTLPANAARTAGAIALAVDTEALRRSELPFSVPVIIIVAIAAIASSAMAVDPAAVEFARGVSAYVREDFEVARRSFRVAVELAPGSSDSWANYGTASWALADTSAAVNGWRHALALEPTANDLHQYVTLARSIGPTSPGWVPSLPRNAAVWLFASLWLGAWLLAWIGNRAAFARDLEWTRRLPMPLVGCALLIGILSIEIETRTAGRRVGVIRHAAALTTDPAIGMDRGPNVATGEMVRIIGRRGAWTRVEASDDRQGWIASSQLLLISDQRP